MEITLVVGYTRRRVSGRSEYVLASCQRTFSDLPRKGESVELAGKAFPVIGIRWVPISTSKEAALVPEVHLMLPAPYGDKKLKERDHLTAQRLLAGFEELKPSSNDS